jgi:hypothetical protein
VDEDREKLEVVFIASDNIKRCSTMGNTTAVLKKLVVEVRCSGTCYNPSYAGDRNGRIAIWDQTRQTS